MDRWGREQLDSVRYRGGMAYEGAKQLGKKIERKVQKKKKVKGGNGVQLKK